MYCIYIYTYIYFIVGPPSKNSGWDGDGPKAPKRKPSLDARMGWIGPWRARQSGEDGAELARFRSQWSSGYN